MSCLASLDDLKNKELLNFFKPMNSKKKEGEKFQYDYYSESEWRILFFKKLLKEKLLIDPCAVENENAHRFYNSLSQDPKNKLRYLAPLDGWLALIIYPSVDVKNAAQQNSEIRGEIADIKENKKDKANRVEGGNWPIEVDLDACRNF